MFELPDAKRVRRSELFNSPPSTSGSSPPALSPDASLQPYYKQSDLDLDFVDVRNDAASTPQTANTHTSVVAAPSLDPSTDHGSNEVFEFRLFSSNSSRSKAVTTTTEGTRPLRAHGTHNIVNIRSPTPPPSDGQGAFVVPYRPHSYYFAAAAANPDREVAYREAAVSGTEVLDRAKRTKWPGTALPWRVIHVHTHANLDTTNSDSSSKHRSRVSTAPTSTSTSTLTSTATPNPTPDRVKPRRTRAGKKRRLALRAKFAQAAAEREKRTRRNREKKVKRKEREKRGKEGGKLGPAMQAR